MESGTKILLIGDSFMQALQVEYENSVSGLLESHLPGVLGFAVAVRNTAVGGWDPDQYLLQLRRSLERDTFKLAIVVLYLGNDVIEFRRERVGARQPDPVHHLRFPRAIAWGEIIDAILYPVNDFLEVRSHLFIFGKTRLRDMLIRMRLSALYFPSTLLRSKSDDPMWANTVAILASMAELTRKHNLPIVFVLVPDAVQVQPGLLAYQVSSFGVDSANVDVDQPSRLLRELMSAEGLTFVDATDALRTEARNGAVLYGEVDSHFSPTGHRVTAAFLEPIVVTTLRASAANRPRSRLER